MTGIVALPTLAVVSAVGLRKELQSRWQVAVLVAVALSAMAALIESSLPLTISERVALWCLPVLAATDAATRSVSRVALLIAMAWALWAHAVQMNYHVAVVSTAIAFGISLPMMYGLRKVYGKEVIGDGDIAFTVWLALALGLVSPASLGLGVLLAGRRREVPLVTYAALAAVALVCFLAIWGRFPWRS